MKRWISLCLCFLLCLGLIVPALFVVPVSAESSTMIYNGVELPNISSVWVSTCPYAFIRLVSGTYYLYLCANLPTKSGNNMFTGGKTYEYTLSSGVWGNKRSSSSGWTLQIYSDAVATPVFVWSNFDIFNDDGSLFASASDPVDPNAPVEIPDFDVLQSWLDTDTYTFVENSTATSFNVAVSGGSVTPTYSYQWYYGSSQGGEFTAIPNETQANFTPKTSAEYIGTSMYFCRITAELDGVTKSADSGYLQVTVTEEPPPTTDPPVTEPSEPDTPVVPDETTPDYSEKLEDIQGSLDDVNNSIGEVGDKVDELPDKITDGMQDLQEQEKQEASSSGDSSAQEVIDIIPNPSDDFLPAIRNLVSVMSYDGTAAVLTMPAVSIPKIGSIVPNIKLLDAQEIDFSEYVTLVPDLILNFIRALFDSALVIYCLYELFTMIGSALSGFMKNTGKGDLYE